MHTQTLIPSVISSKISPVICPTADQFGLLTGHAGLVATEFSYRKDEEIYGEDEPAEYVYQVIQGAISDLQAAFPRTTPDRRVSSAERRLRTGIGN